MVTREAFTCAEPRLLEIVAVGSNVPVPAYAWAIVSCPVTVAVMPSPKFQVTWSQAWMWYGGVQPPGPGRPGGQFAPGKIVKRTLPPATHT